MKFNSQLEKIKMTRFMMAALLLAVSVMPVRAAETYNAAAGIRYSDLDTRGSRGRVLQYDGKLYGGHADVSVSNQGSQGLLDISLTDIGSTEENAAVNLDFGSTLKLSGKWENMHHRQNWVRTGLISNGIHVINPNAITAIPNIGPDEDLMFKRTESEFNAAFFNPKNSAQWLSFQYWRLDKLGNMAARAYQYKVGVAEVDNTKQDITLGVGTNMGEKAAMSLDLVSSKYKDSATPKAEGIPFTYGLKNVTGEQKMTGAEFKTHYDPSKNLAITGAFTGRQRENLDNGYKMNAGVAALNAAYKVSQKLSLTARLYGRMMMIDEAPFRTASPTVLALASTASNNAMKIGQGNQLDKTTVRAELAANFRPVEKVNVKAEYKFEFNHRRDAQTENMANNNRYYFDGYMVPGSDFLNSTANEDVKHTATLSTKVEFPFGIEAEGSFKRLQANRSAFVNQPTWQNDANVGLTVPLPAKVELSLMGGYLQERNKDNAERKYSTKSNTYRAALDWAANSRTFLGADASYEKISTRFNGYFNSGTVATPAAIAAGLPGFSFYESGMTTSQKNTVLGTHARVNLPKGLAVTGRGSYTWSKVSTPLHYWNTANNYSIDDYAPSDVRIARGTVGLEYTPEKLKDLTARASYSIDDWVDKTDVNNSGRASIAMLGASMKF